MPMLFAYLGWDSDDDDDRDYFDSLSDRRDRIIYVFV